MRSSWRGAVFGVVEVVGIVGIVGIVGLVGIVGAVGVAGCGSEQVPPVMPDAVDAVVVDDCSGCQLVALRPALARSGDRLVLEGTFGGDGGIVTFEGGATAPLERLGPNRATVVVPDGAVPGAGAVTVTIGAVTLGPVPFRHVTYEPSVAWFTARDAQGTGPRAAFPQLGARRFTNTATVIGDWVYVIGGSDRTGTTQDIVERARIQADGSLGPLREAPVRLPQGRSNHASVVVGGYLYVIGGIGPNGFSTDVFRAPVDASGELGSFTLAPGATLAGASAAQDALVIGDWVYLVGGMREGRIQRAKIAPDGSLARFEFDDSVVSKVRVDHRAAVIGDHVYVVGGRDGDATNYFADVERAPISPDGELGTFEPVASTLTSVRAGFGLEVVGDAVYALGGKDGDGVQVTIERAAIHADGTLGPFEVLPQRLALARSTTAVVRVADALWLFSGVGDGLVNVPPERASLVGGGTLSAFEVDPAAQLASDGIAEGALAVVDDGAYLYSGEAHDRAAISPRGELGSFVATASVPGVPTSGHAMLRVRDRMFVIGGRDAAGALARIEAAPVADDGALGGFSAAATVLSSPRHGHAAVVLDDALYVLGGVDGEGAALGGTDVCRLTADGNVVDCQVAATTLVQPRHGAAAIVVRDHVYVIGGADGGGAALASVERAVLADGVLGPFQAYPASALVAARRGLRGAAVIGNHVYVIGGLDGDGTALASVERATIAPEGALGPFAIASDATLVHPTADQALLVIGNRVYSVGGRGTAVASGVQRATLQ